jgi:quinol monooxygenase YgiN
MLRGLIAALLFTGAYVSKASEPEEGQQEMTTIVANSQIITSITVFTVAPENQQQLIDILARAAQEVILKQPGFISINIHKSLDKTQVLSYSQWQSRQAFEDALQHATVIPYVQAVLKIATFEPHFYEVVAVIHSDEAGNQSA